MIDGAERLRLSPLAGTWYPGEPESLRTLVLRLLDESPGSLGGKRVSALVVPHAGINYSGGVAAAAYRILREREVETVVLLGPSHRVFFDALAVFPAGAFETPLGRVAVDTEISRELLGSSDRFRAMPEVHDQEHCLEMQLPFLQVVLPRVRIVPVMMGNQSRELVDLAGKALAGALATSSREVLLIASSDLSHYQPRVRARKLDEAVLAAVREFAPEALLDVLEDNPRHACGGGPIVSIMAAARILGANESKVLGYADSGDATGDTGAVVGYLSAAFYRDE
ncbi:MAG TPA: AmmeMemoRadiSam system protein B [Vicinamibacteria bacterium]|nr:AmmeMemoRadiSam system protein B [Vicinamibacteria bacterium]